MTLEPRLATHVHVGAFIRLANASGDFATVLKKGDPTSGAMLLICQVRGQNPKIYERFPTIKGAARWQSIHDGEMPAGQITELIEKRVHHDPDLWVIELDTADHERLNGLLAAGD
jgi:hypothetical protein